MRWSYTHVLFQSLVPFALCIHIIIFFSSPFYNDIFTISFENYVHAHLCLWRRKCAHKNGDFMHININRCVMFLSAFHWKKAIKTSRIWQFIIRKIYVVLSVTVNHFNMYNILYIVCAVHMNDHFFFLFFFCLPTLDFSFRVILQYIVVVVVFFFSSPSLSISQWVCDARLFTYLHINCKRH